MKGKRYKITEVIDIIKNLLGVDITGATIRNWCTKYDLGGKIGDVWYLTEIDIQKITSGDIFLEKYKNKDEVDNDKK